MYFIDEMTDFLARIIHDGVTLSAEEFLEHCRRCFLASYQDLPRPSVHEHFLMQAFTVALRSEDIHTKHGAIIVENSTNHAIGSGYNALFRGAKPEPSMLERPAKYSWFLHAEENAIMNCTKNPLSLPSGARIYITGMPCNDCLQKLVNFGVKDIIIADRQGTKLENADEDQKRDFILRMSGATITKIALTNRWLQRVFLG